MTYPRTPDERYFVVRGRLWRCTNPALDAGKRARLTAALMDARRAVGAALKRRDQAALASARRAVNEAKIALGERGPVWWTDGAPDYNRRMARTTPYAEWRQGLETTPDESPPTNEYAAVAGKRSRATFRRQPALPPHDY